MMFRFGGEYKAYKKDNFISTSIFEISYFNLGTAVAVVTSKKLY
jgi:hypothetical protein